MTAAPTFGEKINSDSNRSPPLVSYIPAPDITAWLWQSKVAGVTFSDSALVLKFFKPDTKILTQVTCLR